MNTPKPRPYWHVDLKWIFGILFFFTAWSALFSHTLSALTERDTATNISATVVATMFSKNGLDDPADIALLREKAALLPGDTIAPIEQLPWMSIPKADLTTKTPSEIRISLFRQLTDPIYDKGLAGAAKQFSADPAEQEKFTNDAALLGILTQKTHDVIALFSTAAIILALICAAGLIYFSAGWGRLVSPGVVLLLISPVGALVSLFLLYPPVNADNPLQKLPPSVLNSIGHSIAEGYFVAIAVGVSLLLAALIGKIVSRTRHSQTSIKK